MNRRSFALSLAGSPALLAQQIEDPTPPGKRPRIAETPPFAEPISTARHNVAPKLRPFLMTQVRLLPGPFKQSSDWNRGYMNRLPADRLLHNFRVNAGLPSAAAPFGGWERPKSELRGHFTGHYLSGCALLHASTGDNDIKAKGAELVSELAKCQAKLGASGYLSAFPLEFFDRLDQRKGV